MVTRDFYYNQNKCLCSVSKAKSFHRLGEWGGGGGAEGGGGGRMVENVLSQFMQSIL